MWVPAFEQMATQRSWRLETLAKAGCPSVSVPVTNTFQRIAAGLQKCDEWRAQTLNRLRADKPQLIVVSVWRQYGSGTSRNWQPGFQSYDAAWLAVADGQLPESYLQSHGGEIPDDAIINFKNDRHSHW